MSNSVVIKDYKKIYCENIIDLILHIQNEEAGLNITLENQLDLVTIEETYQKQGGGFWVALNKSEVIGTIGLMRLKSNEGILKKFFVKSEFRGQKIGLKLYNVMLEFAKSNNIEKIVLETPSIAVQSHKFYEKSGFEKLSKGYIDIPYKCSNEDSYVYILDLK